MAPTAHRPQRCDVSAIHGSEVVVSVVNLGGSLATATAETAITVENTEADGLPEIGCQIVLVGLKTKYVESTLSFGVSSLAAPNSLDQCPVSLVVFLGILNHLPTL